MTEWARPAPDADGEPVALAPFEVFATGATVLGHRDVGTSFADRLHRGGELVREGYEHARDFHARPGHRPGQVPATGAREGGDADIVRPVLVDPVTASRLAISGDLFAEPVHHLAIEVGGLGTGRYLIWDARLTTEQGRPIPATLHLLGSPSMVVTVLELVPRRRLRWRRGRFIAEGVAAIEVLARRLERAAA